MENFIKALGLPEDLAAQLKDEKADQAAIAKTYLEKVTQTALEREKQALLDAAKEEATKNANFAVWNSAEKKVAESLGLNFEEFKGLEKGRFDAMLAKVKADIEQAKANVAEAKKGDQGKLLQFQEQLEQANNELKALKQYKEKEVPELLQKTQKEFMSKYLGKEQMLKAFEALKPKMLDHLDMEVVELLFNQKASIDFVEADGKLKMQILDKTGRMFQKSATENYTDLAAFIEEQILAPKNWLKQQKTSGQPAVPHNQPINNAQGQGGFQPHPGFVEAMKQKGIIK